MQASNFGCTFDQLFLWIFFIKFHRRCLSTSSIPWCKKVKNDQNSNQGGSCLNSITFTPLFQRKEKRTSTKYDISTNSHAPSRTEQTECQRFSLFLGRKRAFSTMDTADDLMETEWQKIEVDQLVEKQFHINKSVNLIQRSRYDSVCKSVDLMHRSSYDTVCRFGMCYGWLCREDSAAWFCNSNENMEYDIGHERRPDKRERDRGIFDGARKE